MIERFLNLVLANTLEVAILLVAGLLLGILVSLLYWRAQVNEREEQIIDLETSVETKDTDMKNMRVRAQDLLNQRKKEIESQNTQLKDYEDRLNEEEKKVEVLNTQLKDHENLLNEREKRTDLLNTQLGQRDEKIQNLTQQISEKDESINQLKKEAADLEKSLKTQLKEYENRLNELEKGIDVLNTQLKDYENLLNEREKRTDLLNTQLGQRDENIQDLNKQIIQKDESINQLKKEAADLDEKNQETVTRAEGAEAKAGELEKSIEELEKSLEEQERSREEQEQETASLQARIQAMQDDFTHIMGIGPKVSSVLRSAGINTFTKLASTDIDKITEILEEENPSLLRLTDPSTWSEQARLASEGDWEALTALQENLKESRRT